MLKCRQRWSFAIRRFCSQIHGDPFSSSRLCSVESRERCIRSMQRSIPKSNKTPERCASVLIPIVIDADRGDSISLLYTMRSRNLRTHCRQVSFPGKWCEQPFTRTSYTSSAIKKINKWFSGGYKDPHDATYADCAIRETEEEIGIDRSNIEVWGESQLVVPRIGPAIMPVVGFIHNFKRTDLKLNESEVEKVFTIPIKHLCNAKCKKHTQFRTDRGYSVPVFTCGDERVWGITAVITNLFLYCLMPKDVFKNKIQFISTYRTNTTQHWPIGWMKGELCSKSCSNQFRWITCPFYL